MLVDALMFGALDAARRWGVRYAVLEHSYDSYLQASLRGPLGLALRARRLRPDRDLRQADVRVVTALPELDRTTPSRNMRHVGPVVPWAPRQETSEPLILVSLSTFGYPRMRQTMQAVIDACRDLPARTVVTTGPHVDPGALRADGVQVHRFLPHAQVMPHARVLVGHGGHGTTCAADALE